MTLAVVAISLLAAAAPAPPVPPVVADWLKQQPWYRLVTPRDAVPDDARERATLERRGKFDPTARGDATGDGREDVLAAVVSESPRGKAYELVAFHSTSDGFEASPRIVHRETVGVLAGVEVGATGRVFPLLCYDCGSPILFLRWNGKEYEESLYREGEEATLLGDGTGRVPLYEEPREGAGVRVMVEPCRTVRILKVMARAPADSRWYEAEVVGPKAGQAATTGYVTSEALSIDPVCLVMP